MIFAACALCAEKKSTPKKTSLSEVELRTMAKASPNVKDAGTLYSVGMATKNDEQKQEYLKASAACLFACDKRDVYKKHIKSNLADAASFEESLKDKCKQCSGAGQKDRRCYDCSGKGRCTTCKGSGKLVSVGFDRANGTKPCHKCKGNGRCRKCGGGGSTKEKCATCGGSGKTFQKYVAERVFRDTCNAIADVKSGKVDSVKTAKAQVKAKEMLQNPIPGDVDEIRKAKENFAKMCNGSGDAIQVNYQGISYSIAGENFVIFEQGIESSGLLTLSWGTVSLVVLRSRTHWYYAVEECAAKLKEWVRVAKQNKVKHVCKEIPHGYIDVNGYPNKITAGKGQTELFRKTVRASYNYSSFVPEQIKFIGTVKSYDDDFKRFQVTLSMVCGEYFNSPIFYTYGTAEEIDKKFVEFLVFVNPKSLEQARDEQEKKESLFR